MTANNDKLVATIRAELEVSAKDFADIAAGQSKLNDKRGGAYVSTVVAGVHAGTAEVFSAAYESLKADINANVGNIGKRLHCGLSKPDKDGKAHYVVPDSLQNATSCILFCLTNGISLTAPVIGKDGKETGEQKARSFSELRKARTEALAAQRETEATPIEKAQAKVRSLAAQIAEGAAALTESEANDVCKILASVLATESGAKAKADAHAEAKSRRAA